MFLQSFISPVCLPWGQESDTVLTDQVVTLTGWGDTKFGKYSAYQPATQALQTKAK